MELDAVLFKNKGRKIRVDVAMARASTPLSIPFFNRSLKVLFCDDLDECIRAATTNAMSLVAGSGPAKKFWDQEQKAIFRDVSRNGFRRRVKNFTDIEKRLLQALGYKVLLQKISLVNDIEKLRGLGDDDDTKGVYLVRVSDSFWLPS